MKVSPLKLSLIAAAVTLGAGSAAMAQSYTRYGAQSGEPYSAGYGAGATSGERAYTPSYGYNANPAPYPYNQGSAYQGSSYRGSAGGAVPQPEADAYRERMQQYRDQQDRYHQQQAQYDAQRHAYSHRAQDWQTRRDAYDVRRDSYDAQRRAYERQRDAYDEEYGPGAWERRYGY